MDMERWCKSGNGGAAEMCCCWSKRHPARDYDRFVSYKVVSKKSSKASIWTQLWRKLKSKKKKILMECGSSTASAASMRFSYDPFSYSQNFDQGFTLDDPDEQLSRLSFSARFAVPSRISFDQDVLVV
ncbi:OLC1v1014745C1 [Oldenlandia corymbosa var. corymbosa]|uniref:OLC1v1014745C1 n=1 Tax=Oldenlandia corymbosa var. corymbosa TaxID=529605 RepID=A0AAV1E1P9_OLDCO|nr:OLC1v1014745C1 [Oldenlandia corymbosa var. corymbosa]